MPIPTPFPIGHEGPSLRAKPLTDVIERLGPIDVLVNGAGVEGPVGAVEDIRPDDVRRVFEVNVMSMFWVCRGSGVRFPSAPQGFRPQRPTVIAHPSHGRRRRRWPVLSGTNMIGSGTMDANEQRAKRQSAIVLQQARLQSDANAGSQCFTCRWWYYRPPRRHDREREFYAQALGLASHQPAKTSNPAMVGECRRHAPQTDKLGLLRTPASLSPRTRMSAANSPNVDAVDLHPARNFKR